MATKADEITGKLLDLQRARVAEAEAKLADEQKKLEWMESLAGDLRKVIEESEGKFATVIATSRSNKPKRQQPNRNSETVAAVPARSGQPEKVLKQHEILDFVDRMDGEFTPHDLRALIEASSPFKIALNPLQCAMARMAKTGKGLECRRKGGRWIEAAYCRKFA